MKVLLIYPNCMGYTRIAPGLAVLNASLKKAGHTVKVFDTTFYKCFKETDDEIRQKTGQVKPVDLRSYGIVYEEIGPEEIEKRLVDSINEFKPDVIAVNVGTEEFTSFSLRLAGTAKPFGKLVIFGGIAVTMSPSEFIENDNIDIICRGEGEDALVELLDALQRGGDHRFIKNLWVKKDGRIFKNDVRPFKNLDELPYLDFDEFDPRHFYRPIDGIVYKMAMVEMTRGCPRVCSYCENHALQKLYKGKGSYVRKKSTGRFINELEYLKDKYNLNFFFFVDDDFTLLSTEEIDDFAEKYKKSVGLPFLVFASAPSVTQKKVEPLKEASCIRVCISVESGNELVRKDVMQRYISNEETVMAFQLIRNMGIRISSTNIIGSPYERRKEIFDTIKVNRKANPNSISTCFLIPYKGTKIRELCLKEGYIKENLVLETGMRGKPVLDLPQISKRELINLQKTIPLYVKLPKYAYPFIYLCEKNGVFSKWLYPRLSKWMWRFE